MHKMIIATLRTCTGCANHVVSISENLIHEYFNCPSYGMWK